MADDGNRSYKFSVTPDYFRSSAQPSGSGLRFSRVEIFHIVVSIAALTLAFALASMGGIEGVQAYSLDTILIIVASSFLAVASGFLLHELAHKKVAQGYGCFAEYRMFPFGLMLAFVTSLFGALFALPGAVMISGRITKRQSGLISLAGPSMNILIGGVCLILMLALTPATMLIDIVGIVASINLFLAVFNLIPVPPLDGSKVVFWNIPVYVASMAGAIALLAVYYIHFTPLL